MGIENIHILKIDDDSRESQVRAVLEEFIAAHHRGEHPDGFKRRECPLCQQGK